MQVMWRWSAELGPEPTSLPRDPLYVNGSCTGRRASRLSLHRAGPEKTLWMFARRQSALLAQQARTKERVSRLPAWREGIIYIATPIYLWRSMPTPASRFRSRNNAESIFIRSRRVLG